MTSDLRQSLIRELDVLDALRTKTIDVMNTANSGDEQLPFLDRVIALTDRRLSLYGLLAGLEKYDSPSDYGKAGVSP